MTDPSVVDSALAKAEKASNFTDDEIAALKEMANAWRGLEAFGRVANLVRIIVVYLGWIIAIYVAVKYAIADWVRSVQK